MDRTNNEIAVSNSFVIVILFAALLFLGKSMYDLIKSKHLSLREKTNLAFVIVIIPVYGSVILYI